MRAEAYPDEIKDLKDALTQATARIHALEELGFEPKQYENLKAHLTQAQERIKVLEHQSRLPSAQYIQEIYAVTEARAQLAKAKEDWQREHAVFKMFANRVCDATQDAQHTNEGICEGVERVCKERDEAVAACASYRQVMHECGSEAGMNWLSCQLALAKTLESTDCGKAFLERMRQAEWLLNHPLLAKMSNQSELTEWRRRYDAFQKLVN